jgi:hypothetical protein
MLVPLLRLKEVLANARLSPLSFPACSTTVIAVALAPRKRLLAQYPLNSRHDWHFEILFVVAIILHLTHIILQGL